MLQLFYLTKLDCLIYLSMVNNAYHRAYGKHSGIPDCCIEFWINEWPREVATKGTYWRYIQNLHWGYVPCPECAGGGYKAKIVDCTRECGKECREDFKNKSKDPLTNQSFGGIL